MARVNWEFLIDLNIYSWDLNPVTRGMTSAIALSPKLKPSECQATN